MTSRLRLQASSGHRLPESTVQPLGRHDSAGTTSPVRTSTSSLCVSLRTPQGRQGRGVSPTVYTDFLESSIGVGVRRCPMLEYSLGFVPDESTRTIEV